MFNVGFGMRQEPADTLVSVDLNRPLVPTPAVSAWLSKRTISSSNPAPTPVQPPHVQYHTARSPAGRSTLDGLRHPADVGQALHGRPTRPMSVGIDASGRKGKDDITPPQADRDINSHTSSPLHREHLLPR